jgi:signal transduction histidine kinase
MRICIVSNSEDFAALLLEFVDPITVLRVRQGESVPESDLCVWDYAPGFEIQPLISAVSSAQHLVLADPQTIESLAGHDLGASVCILLKPVTAFTLRAFTDLALKSWRLRLQARDADWLRLDRDRLLAYVLEVNLKLQEYDQERNSLVARAVHDLRAPLTALYGHCGLLADERLGPVAAEQKDLLERMRSSAKRLARLTSGTLELLVEGRLERPSVRVAGDIGRTLNQAVHDVDELIHDKQIQLSLEIGQPGAPLLFEAEQIQELLVNLLENSCRHTPRQGVIEIRGYPTSGEAEGCDGLPSSDRNIPGVYRVDVHDSGPGVPSYLAEHIFEQYASYSGEKDRSGRGLGLAICKKIIAAHSGTIWATPSLDGGRFSFELPLCMEAVA